MSATGPTIEVVTGNILDFKCDVLVLKYAQGWHGADLAVAKQLNLGGFWDGPMPGEFRVMKPEPSVRVNSSLVFFEGVPNLSSIAYTTLRDFGKNSLLHLDIAAPNVKHIAMTMHGVNIGMDEKEAFLAQLGGMLDALSNARLLPDLERISFVEFRKERAERLRKLLDENQLVKTRPLNRTAAITEPVSQAGSTKIKEKQHVFVAMPFTDEMEDVYIFGIQGPVQHANLLCERVDQDIFTGDILDRIKTRIETAALVIAVLNGANANVYLEVGYAWGKNRKTLLICKDPNDLKFDVKGQRCVIYTSINDLNKKMAKELEVLAK